MRVCLLLLATCLLLASCKKETARTPNPPIISPPPPPLPYSSYLHLEEGNYWIYQVYFIDQYGQASALNEFDSVYAGPDAVINGKRYKVRMVQEAWGAPHTPQYFRDSLHYLLDTAGHIYASFKLFNTVLQQAQIGIDSINYRVQMTERVKLSTVPAGRFLTIAREVNWNINPKYTGSGFTQFLLYTRINEEVGIVTETTRPFTGNRTLRERRLVRYNIQ